jgi:hypothetical protein
MQEPAGWPVDWMGNKKKPIQIGLNLNWFDVPK